MVETGKNQANVSRHLKMLAEAGLVARRREGSQVFYKLVDSLLELLCEIACETIVEEAREDVERRRRLLSDREGKAQRGYPAGAAEP